MERDYGKKNGKKHAGEKKGEGEYLSQRAPAPCLPTARLAAATHRPHGPNVQTLAGKVEESAGRTSVQAGPRRSRAPAQQQTSGRRHSALPTHCPPGSRNPPTSRPEVQTLAGKVEESAGRTSVQAGPRRSHASAQQETSGPRHSALQRPCPPTAPAGSRNPPTSRPEMQTLAGKVAESAGRTSVRAGPRRSRAPAQQETSGPRHSALQRPARLAAATHRPHSQKVQTLAGKVAESAGRIPVRAAPRRSHASAQWHGSFHLHALRPPAAR